MLVDVVVVVGGKQIRSYKRIPMALYKNRLEVWLNGLLKSPEDYVAVRMSKRQTGRETWTT